MRIWQHSLMRSRSSLTHVSGSVVVVCCPKVLMMHTNKRPAQFEEANVVN